MAKNVSLQSNFVDNLRGFRSQNKLKKAMLLLAFMGGGSEFIRGLTIDSQTL